ncbi:M23 family metallopeptidase [Microbacterium sp. SSW1-49]|uniref:M23 family metallopeptidase n=2 Tax=Microbacterium croceum TaxID=2851645 RepID=A0ABT0FF02_9MICO|nr:M23 family metallopeptidase [Microbacterium croceum]
MRLLTCLFTLVCALLLAGEARPWQASAESGLTVAGFTTSSAVPPIVASVSRPSWAWPLAGARSVAAPYRAPAHEYGAGHRGVDLMAEPGTTVFAPAEGVVAFRGTVVDRPLVTIEHPGGLVSTLEPVSSPLTPGAAVVAGQPLGIVGTGGHTPTGAVHLGVRLNGAYINPLLLFGPVTRAVLLPCCPEK